MSALSRVVWREGMHLAQHHFQAQNRYFEDLIGFAVSNLYFMPYGLVACTLDDEALLNGTVSVIHARGVLPDGLTFNFPVDLTPPPLRIRDLFSPTQDSHLVLLAIPAYQGTRANCAPADANPKDTRFVALEKPLIDEISGMDERPVSVAAKNFRLLLDHEMGENLVGMPIARVRRDGSGHFIYDPEYIPPVLQIAGSRRLVEILSRLVEILEVKADALATERTGDRGAIAEYGRSEVASFWLSHAVHSSLAPLRNLLHTGEAHPERLYTELARLAGALCTFSLHSHPRELPLYDHAQLDRCFSQLDRHIRDHLETIIPTNSVVIPLHGGEPNLFGAEIADRRCLDRARWFLGVRSTAAAADVISRVPKLIKLCSEKHIARLVREAYPGLLLEHVVSPPPDLPARVGAHYFSVQRAGPCWQSIVETAEVGAFAPAAISDAELELVVLFE
ncbi:MAG TPA: type VI secretion system baseplate subunit TssK [Longimicrobiaceae bacterium]|nr:type VI secretion system baseplate subunit TssK [Longimicrobiaceae bacterium]